MGCKEKWKEVEDLSIELLLTRHLLGMIGTGFGGLNENREGFEHPQEINKGSIEVR